MPLQVHWFALLFLFTTAAAECQQECGGISVPYPFGLGNSTDCYRDSSFQLTCNRSPNPPVLNFKNFRVVNLSLERAITEIPAAKACNNEAVEQLTTSITLGSGPFTFSTANNLMVFGCNTLGLMGTDEESTLVSGCFSTCSRVKTPKHPTDFKKETNCSGTGCCKSAIPEVPNLTMLATSFQTLSDNGTALKTYNGCTYVFLADSTNYIVTETPEKELYSHVVLDWAIGNKTCEEAERNRNRDETICGQNSYCTNSTNGLGYRCSCLEGYEGNPYKAEGCSDIDECLPSHKNEYPCEGICKNIPGNYTCQCKFGYQGDRRVGCRLDTRIALLIATGAGIFVASTIFCAFWFYKKKVSEKNHRRNGGLLLEHLSLKSYKEAQLEKATKNFDAKQLLGEGGNGWVYKGSFEGMVDIAVKKSKVGDQNRIEQFLNEADIVSKINHKNVVKLLGVCLNRKVPMLVYEFVPNGTLYQHIHGSGSRILDLWRNCVRIAAETAQALDYMHSLAHPPVIHRDVKSTNILLDENYTAKVSDFGASKLVRLDRTIAASQGQGTLGYLDPEYLQTGNLTTKSDVYGFGVVLMELLTKRKPLSRGKFGEMISLVKDFTSADESNQLHRVLRVAAVTEHEIEQVHQVAKLAVKCVEMQGKNRPTMTVVAGVLNGLSKEYQSFQVEENCDEIVSLLDDQEVLTTSVHFELENSATFDPSMIEKVRH